jgi:predicted phage terminase large subunit-like protein
MSCTHILKSVCPCPKSPAAAPAAPEVAPAAAPVDPPKKPRKSNASPWSPNYRDPETGEYVNRKRAPTPEEVLADLLGRAEMGDQDAIAALAPLFAEIDSQLARASFAEFFKQAWRVVEPSTELVWNWHLSLMCAVLQAVFEDWLRAKKSKKYFNKVRNVIFNVPPGSSKSRVIAVAFQAWCWLRCPGMKFICLSVNDDAMMRDARAARDLIRSPWYVGTFKIDWSLKDDQDAVSNYGNTSGGERLSMASKSEIVGLRADCILIDDPNNPKKAENKNERDEVNNLWSTNQANRVNDGMRSLRIGVQQRTHAADWTGNVIELQGLWTPDCGDPKCKNKMSGGGACCNRDGWLQVVIPAEFEPARKFTMPEPLIALLRELGLPEEYLVVEDPRTTPGQSIDSLRMPLEYLAGERKRWAGTTNYANQMQQSPVASEGNKVHRDWLNFCRLAGGVREDLDEIGVSGAAAHSEGGRRPRPAGCHDGEAKVIHQKHYAPSSWDFDWITISIDCASKKTDKGSNYGILVIAGKGGQRFILEDATQRGALHEIIEVLVGSDDNPERPRESGLVQKWRVDSILIEPKAAGPDVMDTLLEQMSKGDIPMVSIWEADPGNTDKEMRLEAAVPYIKNGQLFLLDGAPWLEEFVKELTLFPNGLHDDRVDALSQCLNFRRAVDDEYPDL